MKPSAFWGHTRWGSARVLDPRGKDYSSEEFAALIGGWRDEGFGLAFLRLGADGHANILRQKANHTIALGRQHGHICCLGQCLPNNYTGRTRSLQAIPITAAIKCQFVFWEPAANMTLSTSFTRIIYLYIISRHYKNLMY